MMSVIALSLTEMTIQRKVLTIRLIAVFIGVVGVEILVVGFLFIPFSINEGFQVSDKPDIVDGSLVELRLNEDLGTTRRFATPSQG